MKNSDQLIRFLDLLLSTFALVLLAVPSVVLYGMLRFESETPVYRQRRFGLQRREFILVKFRTMRLGTKEFPSHEVSSDRLTPLGKYLRKLKLDELPQLINVVRGEMSLVGPRPCLPSQIDVIEAREKLGVFDVRPGITGLAQVSGIDMATPQLLAETDAQMIANMSVKNYFKYLWLTAVGKGFGDRTRSI